MTIEAEDRQPPFVARATPSDEAWHKGVPQSARVPCLVGIGILLVFGVGFGAWATLAPLEGAIVASGSFVATGQNKQVQHLEGGILRNILVREGDVVREGQTLLVIDETAVKARLRRLIIRRYRLLTTRARIEAEIYGHENIRVPKELGDSPPNPEVAHLLDRQRIELHARRTKLGAEQEVLRKEIAGLREGINGFNAQLKSAESRVLLFQEELRDKSALLDRQLARKTDVFAIQRAEAGLIGEIGELTGRIADSKERIARADQQISSLQSTAVQQSVEELRQAETELDDVDEQLRAAQDVFDRTEVRSPVAGAVVKINHHTAGGVVAPGAVILELLPLNEELVIEARISPREIANVRSGQDAMVRLSALNQRVTPMVPGRVVYLSPDKVVEQSSDSAVTQSAQGPSFVVRVKLDPIDAHAVAGGMSPTPGMPADLFIKTEERTFFDYIMRPVMDSFARAFRET